MACGRAAVHCSWGSWCKLVLCTAPGTAESLLCLVLTGLNAAGRECLGDSQVQLTVQIAVLLGFPVASCSAWEEAQRFTQHCICVRQLIQALKCCVLPCTLQQRKLPNEPLGWPRCGLCKIACA